MTMRGKTGKKGKKGRNSNRHGLGRHIPAAVQRDVRQACFFGCVICGGLPYQYEHFDPPFADCKKHNAAGIALLCPGCHHDKTSQRISVDQIAEARAQPFCSQSPAKWRMKPGRGYVFRLGSNQLQGPIVALRSDMDGELISVKEDDAGADGEWLLSVNLRARGGRAVLSIVDNEVQVGSGTWDFTLQGTTLTVKDRMDSVAFEIVVFPGENRVDIVKLNMNTPSGDGLLLEADGTLLVETASGGEFRLGGNNMAAHTFLHIP